MKKIIFYVTVFSVLSLTAQSVYGNSFTNHHSNTITENGDNKNEISIGSDRASGDMLLRFTADKEGEARIIILDESGRIVLHQTNQVRNKINKIPIKNATGLTEGTYTVQLISNNKTYTTRFMIWK